MTSWGVPNLQTPLLGVVHAAAPSESTIHLGDPMLCVDGDSGLDARPKADLQVARRLAAICRLLRPYPALLLAALAVLESLVVAQGAVGKVAGSFYQIVVDRQPAALAHALLHAACLYAGCVACSAAGVWLSGALAVGWRRRLAGTLHRRFTAAAALAQPPLALDNPDQRMTADTAALCDGLGQLARLGAGVPFRIVLYSVLAARYVGWRGVIAVYFFFWVAALLQRLVAAPLARRIFAQERREGDLRYAHLRLRQCRAEVAAYRSGTAERVELDAALVAALENQRALVGWRAGLAAAGRATDYSGALLNYALVAAAVLATANTGAEGSGGQDAEFVSNASFMTLALIYAFTEVLDLADQASSVAALAARVGELLEALPPAGDSEIDDDQEDSTGAVAASGTEMRPSELATMLRPPTLLRCFGGAAEFEVSVHALSADLQQEARAVFPDAPHHRPLLAVLAFQFAGGGSIDLASTLDPDTVMSGPWSEMAGRNVVSATLSAAAIEEMDRLLGWLLRWEAALRARLQAAAGGGHVWCDLVDPRSGVALHGTQGARWSEVAAAHSLLRYERRDAGVCPLVVHPLHGSSAYPATMFTDAPLEALCAALAGLADAAPAALLPAAPALLQLHNVAVAVPGEGRLAVSGLTLALRPGEHLLITGPNGAGKSTLLCALCGLHPLLRGAVAIAGRPVVLGAAEADEDDSGNAATAHGLMFVPQRPLAAPGPALWQQLVYPSIRRPSDAQLYGLLQAVGLTLLLERTSGSLDAAPPCPWAECLSPGELQRVAAARVLHRRPALALLDEAAAAVSDDEAVRLYSLIAAQGTTCVSVAQEGGALAAVHTRHLCMGWAGAEAGAWELRELP